MHEELEYDHGDTEEVVLFGSGDASVLFQVWRLVSWATWYVAIALHLSEELGGCVLWSSDVAVVGYLGDWVVDFGRNRSPRWLRRLLRGSMRMFRSFTSPIR